MSAKRITRRGLLKAGGATLGGSILLGAGLIALGETTTVAEGGIASLGPAGVFLKTGT